MKSAQPDDQTSQPLAKSENLPDRRFEGVVLVVGDQKPADVSSLRNWVDAYLQLAVAGVRSPNVAAKIALQLGRFVEFFEAQYGHDRIAGFLKRDTVAWQQDLVGQKLAPSTVNNHLATLSGFTTWVSTHAPQVFPLGDPAKGVSELGLPPLEPRALSEAQVRSLKNMCDRLAKLYGKRGRRWSGEATEPHSRRRPWRDRAIVFVLLSTGLRREELTRVDIFNMEPKTPGALRGSRKAQLTGILGKGKNQRSVFLSQDARMALADYLEKERPHDAGEETTALFVAAGGIPMRRDDGRLSVGAINGILEQIGRLHDAEVSDPTRRISPLRTHDLRHTFAFNLARETNADAYELERRLGHRSQRYIQRYTNPPEETAAGYVERL